MRFLVSVLSAVIVFGVAFLFLRNGVFKSVGLSVEVRGPYVFLFKEHVGAYDQILQDLQEVENWAKISKLGCTETFGEYLEDPNVVEMGRLHSNVGCVLTKPIASHLPEGFSQRNVPARKYVVATFSGSPALGPYKVYGKAQALIRDQHLEADGPVIEVYRPEGRQGLETTYLFPVK